MIRKILLIFMILILGGGYVYSTENKYKIPSPIYKLGIKYPTKVEIYIASDGQFYYSFPGYNITLFGEKTLEEAIKKAKGWIEWKKQDDAMNYNFIGVYNL